MLGVIVRPLACSAHGYRGRGAENPREEAATEAMLPRGRAAELKRRLESRGQDGADVIARRMQKSWDEISHWGSYDFVLINEDLDKTEERLKSYRAEPTR